MPEWPIMHTVPRSFMRIGLNSRAEKGRARRQRLQPSRLHTLPNPPGVVAYDVRQAPKVGPKRLTIAQFRGAPRTERSAP